MQQIYLEAQRKFYQIVHNFDFDFDFDFSYYGYRYRVQIIAL